jgi:hypothetical protein
MSWCKSSKNIVVVEVHIVVFIGPNDNVGYASVDELGLIWLWWG